MKITVKEERPSRRPIQVKLYWNEDEWFLHELTYNQASELRNKLSKILQVAGVEDAARGKDGRS